jgi:hypothetical protein
MDSKFFVIFHKFQMRSIQLQIIRYIPNNTKYVLFFPLIIYIYFSIIIVILYFLLFVEYEKEFDVLNSKEKELMQLESLIETYSFLMCDDYL